MSDNDLLTLALDRSDKAVRKPPGVVDVADGQGDESGYDLTNPNLHHGADAKYGPTVQAPTHSGSVFYSSVGTASGQPVNETLHLAVGNSGPLSPVIADLSGHEGQTFSSDFAAPATGATLTSASLPSSLRIDDHTGSIPGISTGDFGSRPIAVQTASAHDQAIGANFHSAVGDSGPTATAIADQSAYEGKAFSLNASNYFSAPTGDTLTFSASLPAGLSINARTGVISGIPTDSDFGNIGITVNATDVHGQSVSV